MNKNVRLKPQRIYVKVNSDFDSTGFMTPRTITWDDGRTFLIDSVRDFRPAATVGNMQGDCYTILVKGQEKLLFFERSNPLFSSKFGRWFVVRDLDPAN